MTKARTLSLFSLQTPQGQKLRDAVASLANHMHYTVKPELPPLTMAHVAQAVHSDDVVIFDGSIEDGKHNYDIAFEGLNRVDHALLVSRTPLPINFYGTRASDDLTCANAPHYPHTLSNEAILKWLEQTLQERRERPLIQKNRMAYPCIADSSANAAADRLKKQSQIYISYHSRLFKKAAELSAKLRRGVFHNGEERSVNFVDPAMLAYSDEALAGVRRWMVLSTISDIIQACEEFWICDSDDYLDSWWTRGELAILAYFNDRPKKIIRYDPITESRSSLSYNAIPSLSEEQRNRIARWFSESQSKMMGGNSSEHVQSIARMLGWAKSPFFGSPTWKSMLNKHDAVVECNSNQCTRRLRKTRDTSPLRFDIDAFLSLRDPNLFTQTQDELLQAADGRRMRCKQCGAPLRVERASRDRFLYVAPPAARGSNGHALLPFPVYRVSTRPSFWQRLMSCKH